MYSFTISHCQLKLVCKLVYCSCPTDHLIRGHDARWQRR